MTFMPLTKANKKKTFLKWVSCLLYPIQFLKKHKENISAFINSGSEVNIISPTYAKKLGLHIRLTNIGA